MSAARARTAAQPVAPIGPHGVPTQATVDRLSRRRLAAKIVSLPDPAKGRVAACATDEPVIAGTTDEVTVRLPNEHLALSDRLRGPAERAIVVLCGRCQTPAAAHGRFAVSRCSRPWPVC